MPSTTLASSSYNIRPQHSFTYETSSLSNSPRDDSFASYLAVVQNNLTPEFPITPTRLRPTPLQTNLIRKRSDNTEIDIFDADKYFNGSPNPDPATPVEKTTTKPSPSAPLSKSHSLTWTVAGSSCGDSSQTTANSRNVLLRDRRRRMAVGVLGFWCSSCSRKHAVDVNKGKESASVGHNNVEQKQSISRSPASWRIETSSPATWPRQQLRPGSAKSVVKEEDDNGSESSSDLFEIESVAMSRTGNYEPSEASIAWSVMTASMANASVATDRDGEIGKGRRKSGVLSLAGCASHKAVEVVSELETSISPVVARYHVDFEPGGGSGRIVAGRANGTSWHGGSGRIVLP